MGDARIRRETRHGPLHRLIDLGFRRFQNSGVSAGSRHDVTALLRAWSEGDCDAADRFMPLLYAQLRRCAAGHLRREPRHHTLQPTGLLHEAYLRLIDQRHVSWQNRAQFLAVASRMMRRILVDYSRRRRMEKRSGRWLQVGLDEQEVLAPSPDMDVLALNDLLSRLAEFDRRKSRVLELRYFGGMSREEIAHVLQVSPATVDREWRSARAWLYSQLKA
jgi:RNA polymerase sigma factor (TIGR02999 family)